MKRNTMSSMEFEAAANPVVATSSSLHTTVPDDMIKSLFVKTYVYQTYLKDSTIKIEVKDGVVTLTGTVAGELHKELAQETVANLPGVTRVDNQLLTKAEIAHKNADNWIATKVNLTLLFHRYVDAGNTVIEVKDGVVTLEGEASSTAQMELTAEYAKDIEGVKEVKNKMTVAPSPRPMPRTAEELIDDASVTAQVKLALLSHRSTSSVRTKIETQVGEVTLSGMAKNATEKALVTKLVSDIRGVTSVKNQMTVEEVRTR